MEWIFTHGKKAVVTTSQLQSRGEIAPISTSVVSKAFASPVPDPIHSNLDSEVPLTYSFNTEAIQFEHWSEDTMHETDFEFESDDDDDDLEEDFPGQFVFGLNIDEVGSIDIV